MIHSSIEKLYLCSKTSVKIYGAGHNSFIPLSKRYFHTSLLLRNINGNSSILDSDNKKEYNLFDIPLSKWTPDDIMKWVEGLGYEKREIKEIRSQQFVPSRLAKLSIDKSDNFGLSSSVASKFRLDVIEKLIKKDILRILDINEIPIKDDFSKNSSIKLSPSRIAGFYHKKPFKRTLFLMQKRYGKIQKYMQKLQPQNIIDRFYSRILATSAPPGCGKSFFIDLFLNPESYYTLKENEEITVNKERIKIDKEFLNKYKNALVIPVTFNDVMPFDKSEDTNILMQFGFRLIFSYFVDSKIISFMEYFTKVSAMVKQELNLIEIFKFITLHHSSIYNEKNPFILLGIDELTKIEPVDDIKLLFCKLRDLSKIYPWMEILVTTLDYPITKKFFNSSANRAEWIQISIPSVDEVILNLKKDGVFVDDYLECLLYDCNGHLRSINSVVSTYREREKQEDDNNSMTYTDLFIEMRNEIKIDGDANLYYIAPAILNKVGQPSTTIEIKSENESSYKTTYENLITLGYYMNPIHPVTLIIPRITSFQLYVWSENFVSLFKNINSKEMIFGKLVKRIFKLDENWNPTCFEKFHCYWESIRWICFSRCDVREDKDRKNTDSPYYKISEFYKDYSTEESNSMMGLANNYTKNLLNDKLIKIPEHPDVIFIGDKKTKKLHHHLKTLYLGRF